MKTYYVSILTNKKNGVLYIGVSNDLSRRHFEHLMHANKGSFSARYNTDKLVYYEETDSPGAAIAREKQLKAWRQGWKVALIERDNPEWQDLSQGWNDVILNQVQDDIMSIQGDITNVQGDRKRSSA